MMKKHLQLLILAVLLGTSALTVHAQFDYLSSRDTMVSFSCGQLKIEEIKATLDRLSSIDTTQITAGMAEFCHDRGTALQMLGAWSRNDDLLHESAYYFRRSAALSPGTAGESYHALAFVYIMLKDCAKATEAYNLHKKYSKRRHRDRDLAAVLNKLCSG